MPDSLLRKALSTPARRNGVTLLIVFSVALTRVILVSVEIRNRQMGLAAVKAMKGNVWTTGYDYYVRRGEPTWTDWFNEIVGASYDRMSIRIHLNDRPVSDSDLKRFAGVKRLRWLDLGRTQVTDEGLAILRCFPELEVLDLGTTQVTDAGLVHVASLARLRWINIQGTNVTDDGLLQLHRAQDLTVLYVDDTRVTDAGLEHLRDHSGLMILHVQNTQVTDSGLLHLTSMHRLRRLNVLGTQVSAEGVALLKRAVPSCEVVWDPDGRIPNQALEGR